jgi:hypothetical protein
MTLDFRLHESVAVPMSGPSGLATVAAEAVRRDATEANMTTKPSTRRKPAARLPVAEEPPAARNPSKLDQLASMLSRPEGASLAELITATGWQAHSVRGALAGSLKRKGHDIRSEKVDGERRYSIGAAR